MAAKTWDDDFRKDAIEASLQKLGDEYRDDPFRYDGSFCLPVGEKPNQYWTPFWIRVYVAVTGLVCVIGIAGYIVACSVLGMNVPDLLG